MIQMSEVQVGKVYEVHIKNGDHFYATIIAIDGDKMDYIEGGDHMELWYDDCDYFELTAREPETEIIKTKQSADKQLEQDLELLSAFLHMLWAGWYIHQRDNSTPENIARWDRQAKTEYKDLSEEDKEKDRKLARKYLAQINQQGEQKCKKK